VRFGPPDRRSLSFAKKGLFFGEEMSSGPVAHGRSLAVAADTPTKSNFDHRRDVLSSQGLCRAIAIPEIQPC
jgi:hypothetical protein